MYSELGRNFAMNDRFNELYTRLMKENLGLGPMQFTGQGVDVIIRKQKKSAPKKKRSQPKKK